jgi:hypothetical protein
MGGEVQLCRSKWDKEIERKLQRLSSNYLLLAGVTNPNTIPSNASMSIEIASRILFGKSSEPSRARQRND